MSKLLGQCLIMVYQHYKLVLLAILTGCVSFRDTSLYLCSSCLCARPARAIKINVRRTQNILIMKKPIIVTNYTYNHKDHKGEVNTEPSQTVPGQSLTIKEIMHRALQGLLNDDLQRDYPYDNTEDFDFENPVIKADLDLTDLDNAREKTKQLKQTLDNQNKQTQDKNELSQKTQETSNGNDDKKIGTPEKAESEAKRSESTVKE